MGPQERDDYERCLGALPALLRDIPKRVAAAESYRKHQMGQGIRAMFGLNAKRPAAVLAGGALAPVMIGDVKSFYTGMSKPDGEAIDSVSRRFCDMIQRRPEWLAFKHAAEALGVTPTAYIAREVEVLPLHGRVERSAVYVRLDTLGGAAVATPTAPRASAPGA